ncbi:hypothetical protein [Rhizobium paknamense]|uniref:Uncharacterized protein n=1 Tax=Rhizobium paknamense TaxID=1206817 RepID=A0ABU0IL32_9HYPH|nr:hypothetical protein [Rhizobium paknamense]MDQ0458303.1 hypothetical protein [Rhizobium paknamense]
MKTYGWHEIGSVPAAPGVYAWYYIPEITHFDLREMKSEVETLKSQEKIDQAKASLRQFLDRIVGFHAELSRLWSEPLGLDHGSKKN